MADYFGAIRRGDSLTPLNANHPQHIKPEGHPLWFSMLWAIRSLPGNLVIGAQKTVVGQGWTVQKIQHHPQMVPAVEFDDLLQFTDVTEQRAIWQ